VSEPQGLLQRRRTLNHSALSSSCEGSVCDSHPTVPIVALMLSPRQRCQASLLWLLPARSEARAPPHSFRDSADAFHEAAHASALTKVSCVRAGGTSFDLSTRPRSAASQAEQGRAGRPEGRGSGAIRHHTDVQCMCSAGGAGESAPAGRSCVQCGPCRVPCVSRCCCATCRGAHRTATVSVWLTLL
jgi:hypothetical protein